MSSLEFATQMAKEQELESSMKIEGYTHKTIMRVHNDDGSRDVVIYTPYPPSHEYIQAELIKLGSHIYDDYETQLIK